MAVRFSDDQGQARAASKVLHAGSGSYSDVAGLPEGRIACPCEGGRWHRRDWIALARFPQERLTDGKP